jgi:hypothetical protein
MYGRPTSRFGLMVLFLKTDRDAAATNLRN